jgi:tRNA threonylcarbamoyladenosine biosynthesis protein TsaE
MPALPLGVRETDGPEATAALGAECARALAPGDVVELRGDLGSGKTTFVRGAARALGVTGPVTSPTFTLGNLYDAGVRIAHLDLHRLAGSSGEDPGLLDDYFGPKILTFVEWPEVARVWSGEPHLRVAFAHAGGDRRRIELT